MKTLIFLALLITISSCSTKPCECKIFYPDEGRTIVMPTFRAGGKRECDRDYNDNSNQYTTRHNFIYGLGYGCTNCAIACNYVEEAKAP